MCFLQLTILHPIAFRYLLQVEFGVSFLHIFHCFTVYSGSSATTPEECVLPWNHKLQIRNLEDEQISQKFTKKGNVK